MKIRKFVAPSVPQALRQVRDDLGDRAVILNTRKLPNGADPTACVEITAAIDESVVDATSVSTAAPATATDSRVTRSRAELLDRVYGSSAPSVGDRGPGPRAAGRRWSAADDPDRTRSAAQWLDSLPRVERDGQPTASASPTSTPPASAPPPGPTPTPRFDRMPTPSAPESATDPLVLSQLRQLEEVVHRMARHTSGFELPPEVARLGERLRRTGLSEPHVHTCLQQLMRQLASTQMDDADAVVEVAGQVLRDMLPERLDLRVGKQRKVVALAGPSGAGKTTAAAISAAGFARRRQQRGGSAAGEILLLSTDGRRVGALAQVQAFADLIGVSLETAYDEFEVAAALSRHEHARLVLVDVAGCGPHERHDIDAQQRLLAAAGADEVHLVLDGLTGYDHMVETASAWSAVDGRRLLFSKMDQAVRPGVVVSAAIECGVATSYLTLSAQLPGGIRPGELSPYIDWMTGRAPRPYAEAVGPRD